MRGRGALENRVDEKIGSQSEGEAGVGNATRTDVGVLVVLAPHRVDHIANVLDPIPVIADKGPIDLAPGVPDTNVATNESTTAGLLLPEVKEVR